MNLLSETIKDETRNDPNTKMLPGPVRHRQLRSLLQQPSAAKKPLVRFDLPQTRHFGETLASHIKLRNPRPKNPKHLRYYSEGCREKNPTVVAQEGK